MASYAIIGGGIVGASVAYHLSCRTDADVTIYERQSPASETTYRSMAILGRTGNETMTEMKRYGLSLYNDFFSDPKANSRFDLTGSLAVATTSEGDAELEDSLKKESKTGLYTAGGKHEPVEYLPGDEITRTAIVPYLRTDDVEGTRYRPNKGFTRPQEVAYEFLERATENGVTVENNTAVEDVIVEDGAVTALETERGTEDVDHVVCTAGPWNVSLAEKVGLTLPVRHEPAPILQLEPDRSLPFTFPYTHHHESGIYFRGSHEGDIYVGKHDKSTTYEDVEQLDPDTVRDSVSIEFRDLATDVIETLYPFLLNADITEEWVGVGSRTPDRWPILGWTDVEGFSIAAFHSQGIQLAPIAGHIISRQIVDGEPTEYYEDVSISRFDGYSDTYSG
ncbi:NAD(P)/FAD-dependent oxidoreductase [Natrarchaeobius chitinivorans]|nr:FAD-binding oxidoreductase [Natrarchaeobius chitinivorans]